MPISMFLLTYFYFISCIPLFFYAIISHISQQLVLSSIDRKKLMDSIETMIRKQKRSSVELDFKPIIPHDLDLLAPISGTYC